MSQAQNAGSDERVATATRHWGPRFVAQGVDMNDFNRTLARIGAWDSWCREWGATAREYETAAEAAESAGRALTAAEAWRRAGLCWHFGKFVFVDDEEQLRAASDLAVDRYGRGAWGLDPPAERVEIPYDGLALPGLLRRPVGVTRPPVLVMAPGLDSVKEELQTTADHFLRRGVATLAVDGPGQGETEFARPIEPAYERPVAAVIDWLEGRDDVDAGRLGFYGVSLGGYYAVRAAAREPRIRAAIELAGTYSLADNWANRSPISRAAFRKRSGAGSDEEAEERARGIDMTGLGERIRCPLLILHGKLDPITPYAGAERLAAETPGALLASFEDGNHGMTNRVFESRSLMSDWMAEKLAR
ncbi:MAG: alpha/beta hydrolase family protein [Candidatus Dormibacterales bacterium]